MRRIDFTDTIQIRNTKHRVLVAGLYEREPKTRYSPALVEVDVEAVTCVYTGEELLDYLSDEELDRLERAIEEKVLEGEGGP